MTSEQRRYAVSQDMRVELETRPPASQFPEHTSGNVVRHLDHVFAGTPPSQARKIMLSKLNAKHR